MRTGSYVAFMMICGAFMAIGFTSIIALASELISRETFEGKDDE